MVEVEPGIWALIAGDADGNGAIDAVDKNDFWRVENGTTYDYTKNSDFNLDGNLDAVDKNDYWRVNNGKATQVP
jgi:flagellar basal body rod protein FlgG